MIAMNFTMAGAEGRRGVALLLVIGVVSLLTVVIIRFHHSAGGSVDGAFRYRDQEVMLAAVQSGIELGCAVLQADLQRDDVDTLSDSWAMLAQYRLPAAVSGVEMDLRITDLDGRLPVNSLVVSPSTVVPGDLHVMLSQAAFYRETLLRLLGNGKFAIEGATAAREIVDSLVDWIDENDTVSLFGAEREYYQMLPKPYRPRNGPIMFVGELLLVKGMTPELLYGTGEKLALADYITVHGSSGQININTAPRELLQAMDTRLQETDIDTLDLFRRDGQQRALLGDAGWYRIVPGVPRTMMLDTMNLGTSSTYFLVSAAASGSAGRMVGSAVVRRAKTGQVMIMLVEFD